MVDEPLAVDLPALREVLEAVGQSELPQRLLNQVPRKLLLVLSFYLESCCRSHDLRVICAPWVHLLTEYILGRSLEAAILMPSSDTASERAIVRVSPTLMLSIVALTSTLYCIFGIIFIYLCYNICCEDKLLT